MFDQYTNETFHGAERGAVDHHGTVGLVVGADVFKLKSFGQIVVELDGSQLPFSPDAISDDEVGLRPVERGFTRLGLRLDAQLTANIDKGALRFVPTFFASHILGVVGIAKAKPHAVNGRGPGC